MPMVMHHPLHRAVASTVTASTVIPLAVALLLVAACSDDGAATTATQASEATGESSGTATETSTATATATATATSASGTASDSATTTTTTTTTTTASTSATTNATTDATTGLATTGLETSGSGTTTDDTTTTGGDPKVVRFVVLGDTGEGNEDQYSVAQAIVEVCAEKGCDFAVLTGDNFYDTGVTSVDDPQWQTKFEMPYEDITFPIYAVLGNHDYGGGGIGVDFNTDKPNYQVQYTKQSQLWKMPAKYYDFELGPATFWALDTNQVMTDPINGDSDPQKNWLKNGTGVANTTWNIAFGHHPYISNGDHGNAGAYENLEAIPFPFVNGKNVKTFMDEALCGKIDVYISGHDHNLQWLQPTCGTEFIVSGAGSKAEDLPGNNPFFFQVGMMEGFVWIELIDNAFHGAIYDKNGNELYTRDFVK